MVIITDDQGFHTDLTQQYITYKFRCGDPGKFLAERLHDQMIDPVFFEEERSFLHCGNELQITVIRLENHPWMRKKCEQNRFALCFPGHIIQSLNNLIVTGMNSVEGADGHHRILQTGKLFN